MEHEDFFIHCKCKEPDKNIVWHIIGVYGTSADEDREYQFKKLSTIISMSGPCLIVCGDFNLIKDSSGKRGGQLYDMDKILFFRNLKNDNRLLDMGAEGHPFTWNNRWQGNGNIQQRLDRFLVSHQWFEIYESHRLQHLVELESDHRLILLESHAVGEKNKKQFKYDERWSGNEEVKMLIKDAWSQDARGSPMYQVHSKLKFCRQKPVDWIRKRNLNSLRNLNAFKA